MTVGLVVAGGYSMRFGLAEKALVEIDSEPMLARIVGTLETVVDDVVVDCRADQVAPFETALTSSDCVDDCPTFAIDEESDAGPIAGIANGLSAIVENRHTPGIPNTPNTADIPNTFNTANIPDIADANADEVLLLSCDRPGISSELLHHLVDRRQRHDVDVALPAVSGYLQPLCGAYRTDALVRAVADALEIGERRLISIPESLSRHPVTERSLAEIVDPAAIASIDTPLDARLRSQAVQSHSAGDDHGASAAVFDDPTVLAGD